MNFHSVFDQMENQARMGTKDQVINKDAPLKPQEKHIHLFHIEEIKYSPTVR